MTNFIKENSFELTFDGMDLKFTSLRVIYILSPILITLFTQERNVYNESLLYDWCKDGDLKSYVTGEFEVLMSGRNTTQPLNFTELLGKSSLDLMVFIRNVSGRVS